MALDLERAWNKADESDRLIAEAKILQKSLMHRTSDAWEKDLYRLLGEASELTREATKQVGLDWAPEPAGDQVDDIIEIEKANRQVRERAVDLTPLFWHSLVESFMSPRMLLFLVWFVGFAASFVLVLLTTIDSSPETVGSYLLKTSGLFAPYLMPIIAFWFVRKSDKQPKLDAFDGPYLAALLCSIFYNAVLFLVLLSIRGLDEHNVVEDRLDLANTMAAILAFLVGPAIGYYFGKAEDGGGNGGGNGLAAEGAPAGA